MPVAVPGADNTSVGELEIVPVGSHFKETKTHTRTNSLMYNYVIIACFGDCCELGCVRKNNGWGRIYSDSQDRPLGH